MPIQVEVPGRGIVEFPDGTPPDVMEQALADFAQPQEGFIDTAVDWLPAAGGLAGGLAGAVGGPVVAAGLAGLGGAAGRTTQRIIEGLRGRDVPQGLDLVQDIGLEGAKQAAFEAVGGAAGGALTSAGRRLYSGLLKPRDAVVERFPTVVADLMRHGRTITQGSRRKVVQGMKRVGGEKQALLAAADASGKTIPRETLRSGLDDVLEEAIKSSDTPVSELQTLAKIERALLPDEQAISVTRADAIKSSLQNKAQAGFRQRAIGNRISETPMNARMAVAKKAQHAVEAAAPGVKALNQKYATLKGESTALRHAIKREGNTNLIGGAKDLWGLAGAGAGYVGSGGDPQTAATLGILARILATPSTGSVAALLMDRAGRGTRVVAPQLLRLLAASHEQEQ